MSSPVACGSSWTPNRPKVGALRLKKAADQAIREVGSQNDPPQWTDAFVMNQRVSPPGTAKGRRAWLFLSLLLPALASKMSTQATSLPLPVDGPAPLVPEQSDRPYLAFVGPPPLRFEDLLPPPDLSTHPTAGAPPRPSAQEAMETKVAKASSVASAPVRPTTAVKAIAAPAPKGPTVAPILSDDVPAQVRAEDFLPYFQFPGSARADTAPTAPSSLPPSSATYTQQ
jgi:hypothetical protein